MDPTSILHAPIDLCAADGSALLIVSHGCKSYPFAHVDSNVTGIDLETYYLGIAVPLLLLRLRS
jgi:hypothetical protein